MEPIIQLIQDIIYECFSCSLEDMKSPDRKKAFRYTDERVIFCYNCMKRGVTCTALGDKLHRNHATILYLRTKYTNLYQYDKNFKVKADLFNKCLREKENELFKQHKHE